MKIQNAFRVGLVGTLGVGVGLLILSRSASPLDDHRLHRRGTFLALGLDPAISWPRAPGASAGAILIVMTGVGPLVAASSAVVPIVVDQVSQLVEEIPRIVARVNSQDWRRPAGAVPPGAVDEISQQVTTASPTSSPIPS